MTRNRIFSSIAVTLRKVLFMDKGSNGTLTVVHLPHVDVIERVSQLLSIIDATESLISQRSGDIGNYIFKTSVEDEDDKKKVQPFLDKLASINNWSIDLADPNKVLHVESKEHDNHQVIHLLQTLGFVCERLSH